MDWIPTQRSAKGRLVLGAIEAFSNVGFDGVNVADLTRSVGVTTGVLYHHFGSKEGLYRVVREELERRVVDRMDGALAALTDSPDRAITGTVLVGFDAALVLKAHRVLAEAPRPESPDRVTDFFRGLCHDRPAGVEIILAAAWRAALQMVANGKDPKDAKNALAWMMMQQPDHRP